MLVFSRYRLARVVYTQMFIVITFRSRRFTANVAHVRPRATVNAHVVFEIIRAMETLAAHGTVKRLSFFMLTYMSYAIVFAYKLSATVIARIRSDRLVRIHMGYIVRLAHKRPFALITFKWFGRSSRMRPFVQF